MSSMTECNVCPPTSIDGSASGRKPNRRALSEGLWIGDHGVTQRSVPRISTTTASDPPSRLPCDADGASPTSRSSQRRQNSAADGPRGRRRREARRRQPDGASTALFKSDARIITHSPQWRRRRDHARCGTRQMMVMPPGQERLHVPERRCHQRCSAPQVHRPMSPVRPRADEGPLGKNPSRSTGFWIRNSRSAV